MCTLMAFHAIFRVLKLSGIAHSRAVRNSWEYTGWGTKKPAIGTLKEDMSAQKEIQSLSRD